MAGDKGHSGSRESLFNKPLFWKGLLAGMILSLLFFTFSCFVASCFSTFLAPTTFARSSTSLPAAAPDSGLGFDQKQNALDFPTEGASQRGLEGVPLLERRQRAIRTLVEEVRKRAPEEIQERCVSVIEGRPGSLYRGWSQAGQDWLLFHNFFWEIPYGQGSYVDIGANNPEDLSNTYFFDRCLGWRGACIEPNPDYHHLYPKHGRTCSLIKNCISDTVGKMYYSEGGILGRIGLQPLKGAIEVECRSLAEVLVEHKLTAATFATIDIEGAEVPTLRCFPFAAFDISTWVAEVDKSPGLAALFVRAGYAHIMDIVCPVDQVYSNVTRVGWFLDSIFRKQTPLIVGPPFLPGQPLYGSGPKGACLPETHGTEKCPEQIPVIDRLEVHRKTDFTFKKGECKVPYPEGSGLSRAEFVHPLANHPAAAIPQVLKKRRG